MNKKDLKLSEIKQYFNNMPIVYLATNSKNQPRVRPMALIEFEGEYFFTSRSYEEKMDQIKSNEKIELSFMIKGDHEGMIRASGKASVVKDLQTKEKVIPAITFFDNYYKNAEDPNYGLIKIVFEEVRTLSKGVRHKFIWK